eukprot:CAMPEP_0170099810 /NCGR_PEP_ID=MMETSP0020_2-20130122/1260_1 /TAXON_ID=98059 /ORGANISM="Dinobryon sp., Strain UTEXLB2267" /LENGTH=2023 /DNA_ID=CAMNT_0010322537 /DNA_START=155 /DNA_END=6224 /DNA_ORIENTATION=-
MSSNTSTQGNSEFDSNKFHSSSILQSSDILAPYILSCNYAEGSTKLLNLTLNGIHNLLSFEMVPPHDVKNILRVLSIQACSGSQLSGPSNANSTGIGSRLQPESQLKVLQITLLMLNFLSSPVFASQNSEHLNEQTICSFLSLTLQLCDSRNNISVSSAAFGTARQIIALVFDGAQRDLDSTISGNLPPAPQPHFTAEVDAQLAKGAHTLFKELCLLVAGQQGDFLGGLLPGRGMLQLQALDLLGEALSGWGMGLLLPCHTFRHLLASCLCPTITSLVRGLPQEFASLALRPSQSSGGQQAVSYCGRVLRMARFLLVDGLRCEALLGPLEGLLCAVIHCLQPVRRAASEEEAHPPPRNRPSLSSPASSPPSALPPSSGDLSEAGPSLRSRLEEASSLLLAGSGPGSFISRLGLGLGTPAAASLHAGHSSSALSSGNGTVGTPSSTHRNPHSSSTNNAVVASSTSKGSTPHAAASNPSWQGLFVTLRPSPPTAQLPGPALLQHLTFSQPQTNSHQLLPLQQQQIPAHPAAACLQLLLELITLQERYLLCLTTSAIGIRFLELLLINSCLCAALLLTSAMQIDSNVKDLELAAMHSPLAVLLSQASGAGEGSEDGERSVRTLLEYVLAADKGLKPVDVFLLAFQLLQMVPRLVLKLSLQSAASAVSGEAVAGDMLLTPLTHSLLPLPPGLLDPATHSNGSSNECPEEEEGWVGRLRACLGRVCECVYENSLDACSALLDQVDNATILRQALSIVSELALCAGLLRMSKASEIVLSVLCKYMVPPWQSADLLLPPSTASSSASDSNTSSSNLAAVTLTPAQQRLQALDLAPLRWRHIQAAVRLFQAIHMLADSVSDWDSVVDCFEQLVHYLHHLRTARPALVTASIAASAAVGSTCAVASGLELDKLSAAIERFKGFSLFLSDSALVRLMTSLVALSMNNLAVLETSSSDGNPSGSSDEANTTVTINNSTTATTLLNPASGSGVGPSELDGGDYLRAGLDRGVVSFSLQAVVEISRMNAFRISTIWQMVTSHLRMIASLKSGSIRAVAVAASLDIIVTSLLQLKTPQSPLLTAPLVFLNEFSPTHHSNSVTNTDSNTTTTNQNHNNINNGSGKESEEDRYASPLLSDEVLYSYILPPFETVFMGRDMHRTLLVSRFQRDCAQQSQLQRVKLTQRDLLAALRTLSQVRYSDVRILLLAGLEQLLQKRGLDIDAEGWCVILELLGSVPASMGPDSSLPSPLLAEDDPNPSHNSHGSPLEGPSVSTSVPSAWPREALSASFNCMKLIVDEFLDVLICLPLPSHSHLPSSTMTTLLITCLAAFTAQSRDVNVSLTSVETMWKVADVAITGQTGGGGVLDSLLGHLYSLSMDPRPEIRHCAMNTLFSAMGAHAASISLRQWQLVFDNIIFSLFKKAGDRSALAVRFKEEAMAPELKKGVKMSVHHSRDTAQKQWSETRVLALRGLSRVIRTCTRFLLQEGWFCEVWADSIAVSHRAMHTACEDLEVAVAALDVVFSMLKTVIHMDTAVGATAATSSQQDPPGKHKAGSKPLPGMSRNHTSTVQSGGSKSSSSVGNAAATPVLSKEEFENVEACKETLWQLTWKAVHDAAGFPCPSPELALALSQRVLDFYKARAEREFRYSDNVRVLLEIAVTVARPRLCSSAVALSTLQQPLPLCQAPESDPMSMRHGRASELQLHRSVLELLREVRPADSAALACFVSALAELCFAVHSCYMPLPGAAALSSGSSHSNSSEMAVVVLGPVSERLRQEACERLLSLLAESSPAVQAVLVEVVLTAAATPPGAAERGLGPQGDGIDAMCEGLGLGHSARRSSLSEQSSSSSGGSVHSGSSGGGGGGFFSSLGLMMSSAPPTAQSNPNPNPNHSSPLRKFPKLPNPTPSDPNPSQWVGFYPLASEWRLLLAVFQHCCSTTSATSSPVMLAESSWPCLLAAAACLLSPWRPHELGSPSSLNLTLTHTATAQSLMTLLLQLTRLPGISPWRVLSLVDVLSSSCCLLVLATSHREEDGEEGEGSV